jgi:hypothetical protein
MTEQSSLQFKNLDAELWILKRLQMHLAQVFDGRTDPDVRRERVRLAIIAGGLESIVIGHRAGGGSETYTQAFERLYGEPLEPPRKGKS